MGCQPGGLLEYRDGGSIVSKGKSGRSAEKHSNGLEGRLNAAVYQSVRTSQTDRFGDKHVAVEAKESS